MFQSVAPCPGKVVFQLDPFPVPELKILSEKAEVRELPVAEPVAVTIPEQKTAMMEEVGEETIVETVSAAMAEEEFSSQPEPVLEVAESLSEITEFFSENVEPGGESFESESEDSFPVEEPAGMVSPFLKAEEVVADSFEEVDKVEEVLAPPTEFYEASTPDETGEIIEETVEVETPVVSIMEEDSEGAGKDPFAALAAEVSAESSGESVQPANPFESLVAASVEVPETKAASTEFYEQPKEMAEVSTPSVTSWQPPAPSDKKKNARFGAFFR